MSEEQQEAALTAFIQDVVRNHYEHFDRPLFLATVGSRVSANESVSLPENMRLYEFIERNLADSMVLIRHARDPKIIAVADHAHAEAVRSILESTDGVPPRTTRLPYSLRVAFCRSVAEGETISYRIQPPFRYHLGSDPPDASYVRIPEEYRMPGIDVPKSATLPEDQEAKLQRNIERWMKDNAIPFDAFRHRREQTTRYDSSALQRLIDAQPPDLRRRLVIPADIALLLSKSS